MLSIMGKVTFHKLNLKMRLISTNNVKSVPKSLPDMMFPGQKIHGINDSD